MNNSIVVIGCHIINNQANYLLSSLVNDIINNNLDYGIVANSKISDIHYKKSKFFLFDSENYKFEETKSSEFWFENDEFKIKSPFLYYGSIPNYSFGATSLFINSVILAKKYGYRFLHWLEYDSDLNLYEINNNTEILSKNEHSCVLYGTNSEGHPIAGSFISLNLDLVDITKFYTNTNQRIKILNQCDNSGEKFTHNYLLGTENIFYKDVNVLGTKNKFNQALQNKIEFVFFEEGNELKLFLKNNTNDCIDYSISTNVNKIKNTLQPLHWMFIRLGELYEINHIYFKFDNKQFYLNLNNDEDVKKYIKSNFIYRK